MKLWFVHYMTDLTHYKVSHQRESLTSLSGLQRTICHENTQSSTLIIGEKTKEENTLMKKTGRANFKKVKYLFLSN